MTTSFTPAKNWLPDFGFGPGVAGKAAAFGVLAAGAALIEVSLIPGLLIGGAAVLAPRLLPRDALRGLGDRLRRTATSLTPASSTPPAHPAGVQTSGEPVAFDTWRAVIKTLTYRVMVTTADFGANYFVIGELTAAAGLSSLSLVAGPIAYFAHEAAWHYYGPTASDTNPLDATVHVPMHMPIPGTATGKDNGRTRIAGVNVSRALAKTVTYEGVTAVSEFTVNYLFVRDLVAAAGLTTFSVVISPFVYYVHEKAWDYYDATKAQAPAGSARQLSPAA